MTLATWGPKALCKALADATAALVAEGASATERLVVCNLLGWGFQRDPADRPQSSKEVLEHPFFSGDAVGEAMGDAAEEGAEEEAEGGEEEVEWAEEEAEWVEDEVEGAEETKSDEEQTTTEATSRVTVAEVNSLAERLHLTTKFHIAAELGGPLSVFDDPATTCGASTRR